MRAVGNSDFVSLALNATRHVLSADEQIRCAELADMIPSMTRTANNHVPDTQQPKLLWFMVLHPPAEKVDVDAKARLAWRALLSDVQSCVRSARLYAPSLQPHLMYLGGAIDERSDLLTQWMALNNVPVHHWNGPDEPGEQAMSFWHRLSTRASLSSSLSAGLSPAVWGKLDLPLLVRRLRRRGELQANVHHDLVLVTDTDLVFTRDVSIDALLASQLLQRSTAPSQQQQQQQQQPPPPLRPHHPEAARTDSPVPVLAAANDLGGPGINGGVLLLNVSGFLPLLRPMLAYSEGRRFHFGLNEQTMLNHFLGAPDGKKINRLPAIYNGRPSERCRHARDPSPNEPCSTGTSPSLSKFHERSPPLCADVAVWHFQGAKEWRVGTGAEFALDASCLYRNTAGICSSHLTDSISGCEPRFDQCRSFSPRESDSEHPDPHHSVHPTVSTRSVYGDTVGALFNKPYIPWYRTLLLSTQATSLTAFVVQANAKRCMRGHCYPRFSRRPEHAVHRRAATPPTTAHNREHEAHQVSLTRSPLRLQRCAELLPRSQSSRLTKHGESVNDMTKR